VNCSFGVAPSDTLGRWRCEPGFRRSADVENVCFLLLGHVCQLGRVGQLFLADTCGMQSLRRSFVAGRLRVLATYVCLPCHVCQLYLADMGQKGQNSGDAQRWRSSRDDLCAAGRRFVVRLSKSGMVHLYSRGLGGHFQHKSLECVAGRWNGQPFHSSGSLPSPPRKGEGARGFL